MDKETRVFACRKCGNEISGRFYDESDEWWLERMGGGFIDSNRQKDAELRGAKCSNCGHVVPLISVSEFRHHHLTIFSQKVQEQLTPFGYLRDIFQFK